MQVILFWFLIAFCLLWIGSGLAVKTVTKIAHSLATSSFFISFFILGVFTSITEITIGIDALISNKPEIYVGNLIGSTVVVYLLIIPLLAILNNGIKLNHSLKISDVITAALVGALPAILTLDNQFGITDGIICVVLYIYFISMLDKKSNLISKLIHKKSASKLLIENCLKLIVAVLFVYAGGHILVENTPKLAELLNISPFIVSVVLISFGSNIPEMSIAIRSFMAKQKDIAFGNYLGSASFNTLELGLLSIANKLPAPADGSNYSVFAYVLGLIFLIVFIKSKNTLARSEGLVLLAGYALFLFLELFTGPGWHL